MKKQKITISSLISEAELLTNENESESVKLIENLHACISKKGITVYALLQFQTSKNAKIKKESSRLLEQIPTAKLDYASIIQALYTPNEFLIAEAHKLLNRIPPKNFDYEILISLSGVNRTPVSLAANNLLRKHFNKITNPNNKFALRVSKLVTASDYRELFSLLKKVKTPHLIREVSEALQMIPIEKIDYKVILSFRKSIHKTVAEVAGTVFKKFTKRDVSITYLVSLFTEPEARIRNLVWEFFEAHCTKNDFNYLHLVELQKSENKKMSRDATILTMTYFPESFSYISLLKLQDSLSDRLKNQSTALFKSLSFPETDYDILMSLYNTSIHSGPKFESIKLIFQNHKDAITRAFIEEIFNSEKIDLINEAKNFLLDRLYPKEIES